MSYEGYNQHPDFEVLPRLLPWYQPGPKQLRPSWKTQSLAVLDHGPRPSSESQDWRTKLLDRPRPAESKRSRVLPLLERPNEASHRIPPTVLAYTWCSSFPCSSEHSLSRSLRPRLIPNGYTPFRSGVLNCLPTLSFDTFSRPCRASKCRNMSSRFNDCTTVTRIPSMPQNVR